MRGGRWLGFSVLLLTVAISVLGLIGSSAGIPAPPIVLLLVAAGIAVWMVFGRTGRDRRERPDHPADDPWASVEAPESPERRSRFGWVFTVFFALYVTSAVVWLIAGLIPAITHASPSFHAALHRWGRGDDLVAQLAGNAARASHNAYSVWPVTFEYLFSAVSLSLGIFLAARGPRHLAARLLAIGMVGTAVAFNLEGHWARQVFPVGWLGPIELWHNVLIHMLAGVSYVFALLLFPDGKLAHPRRAPLILVGVVVFAFLTLITVEDHTFGLVLVFGVITPIAGVVSQLGRYRRARTAEGRRRSRIVLLGLSFAFVMAVGLSASSAAFGSAPEGVTRDFELRALPSGTYFFRCDPHPDTMNGRVIVGPATAATAGVEPPVFKVDAVAGDFDRETISFPAHQNLVIRFTNRDSDGHNIAIYGDASAAHALFVGDVFSGNDLTARAFRVFQPVFVAIPLTLFFGILRFRLWRFERLVHKAFVYGMLAVFITLVYAAVVVGIGRAVGNNGDGGGGNILLSMVATGIVAVGFEPLRVRLQRLANILVYGKRVSPYEVLTDFSERMAGAISIDEVLPRMAEAAARGVGGVRSRVRVFLPDGGERSETWPEGAEGDRFDRQLLIRHNAEPVGDVWVAKPPGESLTDEEERLLADLASQAGLALQNVRLTAELQARLDEISAQANEIRASRQRIVAAQDAAARRLERNIHDGAQQQLVAIAVKARLAQTLAQRDPARAEEVLSSLGAEAEEALQTLRDLARGIYPPLLADKGLGAALEAHARKVDIPVAVVSDGLGRYPLETEAAVYFCCLEAMQNVTKYASASSVALRLDASNGWLNFSVTDDGSGFETGGVRRGSGLQNMVDRLAALGGSLEVRSAVGQGTTIAGHVPVVPGPAGSEGRP